MEEHNRNSYKEPLCWICYCRLITAVEENDLKFNNIHSLGTSNAYKFYNNPSNIWGGCICGQTIEQLTLGCLSNITRLSSLL